MSKCFARQYSDQKICHQCGLMWDCGDPEPPPCRREADDEIGIISIVDAATASIDSVKEGLRFRSDHWTNPSLYNFLLGMSVAMYLMSVVCVLFFDLRLSVAFGAASGVFVIFTMLINLRNLKS